jgi:hypothetical protein
MDSLEHPASAFDPFWGDPAFRTGSADPWGHAPGNLAYFLGRDGVLITCDSEQRQPPATTAAWGHR